MSVPDPYKVLQVDPEAEDEVIEAAYRRLARKYHPDVSPGDEARERMVRINQAWEMVKDPARRAAVDRARARRDASAAASAASSVRAHGVDPVSRTPGRGDAGAQSGSGSRSRDWKGASPPPEWPPGVRDPLADDPTARTQRTSPDWSPGRSTSGHGYDASMRSSESAGPPPGNPSGTVLNFGRYAGWSLGEIGRTDLEYLEWLDRMPIGRAYQAEIDALLRARGRRTSGSAQSHSQQGLYRRR
jgi:curved DNA-binding protein CbpA